MVFALSQESFEVKIYEGEIELEYWMHLYVQVKVQVCEMKGSSQARSVGDSVSGHGPSNNLKRDLQVMSWLHANYYV